VDEVLLTATRGTWGRLAKLLCRALPPLADVRLVWPR